jgi:hypothetical protein
MWYNPFIEHKKVINSLKLKYSKGRYSGELIHGPKSLEIEVNDIIDYFLNLEYSPQQLFKYLQRYFAELLNTEVITEINSDPIGVDMDGENFFESDKVYVVCISIQGPTIKEFTGLEYYKSEDYLTLLIKLNMVLYVSKDRDKCWTRFPSYLDLWKTMKNN